MPRIRKKSLTFSIRPVVRFLAESKDLKPKECLLQNVTLLVFKIKTKIPLLAKRPTCSIFLILTTSTFLCNLSGSTASARQPGSAFQSTSAMWFSCREQAANLATLCPLQDKTCPKLILPTRPILNLHPAHPE